MPDETLEIYGCKFIMSPYVSDFARVPRSFRERFFSLPWRPWEKNSTIEEPHLLEFLPNQYFVSPKTFLKLKDELAEHTPMPELAGET